jgi:D-alanine-D-alanine ligase
MSVAERIDETGRCVAVLCGGNSSERDVSLVSGAAVAEALASLDVPFELYELVDNHLPEELDPSGHLVLPVIHGTYGEDGRLSADLDQGGFVYAGCDQQSSVLCFDKVATKAMAARMGLPVAKDRLLVAGESVAYDQLKTELGSPMILKPRHDGSSVGLHLVDSHEQFESVCGDLLKTDYLAESYMDGIDLTVGILGGNALGVVGVRPEGGLYDYQHKYTAGMSHYEVPAQIDAELASQLKQWSEQVFAGCHCRDLARVDYRMSNSGEVIFLEINTIPGMTPTSLLPKSALCEGISFKDLVLRWIGFSLNRITQS